MTLQDLIDYAERNNIDPKTATIVLEVDYPDTYDLLEHGESSYNSGITYEISLSPTFDGSELTLEGTV